VAALFVFCLTLACPSFAAEDDEDEPPDYRPGLVATYQAPEGTPVVRRDNDVQFVWRGESPDPRIPAGPFTARWQGRLFVTSPGKHQLHIFAQGKLRLIVAGKVYLKKTAGEPRWLATEPMTLDYGYHPLDLDFQKSGDEARVSLYWSGPNFQLEPLTERNLVHEPRQSPDESFAHGRLLARALRCEACHGAAQARLTAPELTKVSGNFDQGWLVRWLTAQPRGSTDDEPIDQVRRRMPHLGLSEADGRAIAAFLLANSPPVIRTAEAKPVRKSPAKPKSAAAKKQSAKPKSAGGRKKPPKPRPRTEPSAKEGEDLLNTVGCLACHQVEQRGLAALFGGGDLSGVADKRPADFFGRWLADPATINPAHRMPVFKLADLERQDLALYLATLKPKDTVARSSEIVSSPEVIERGRELVAQWRCGACHQLPTQATAQKPHLPPLTAGSRWDNSCLAGGDPAKCRPAYALSKAQCDALRAYYSQLPSGDRPSAIDGQFVLAERNCLGCHARGLSPGIAGQAPRLTAARPDLAPLLPALAPPSLAGVGDKLHDEALEAAILIKNPPLRPWLKIRMPKFPLAADEMRAIVHELIDHDRVPPLSHGTSPSGSAPDEHDPAVLSAGSRLVTSDGFGCTSCHKIGDSEPLQVTLAAHGTDLSLVGNRIRRPWFDRWVRNPARIVPRMEMPAIMLPVRGVMHEKLAGQLSAVWTALNTPGFEPPLPNPVRIVRRRNMPDKPEPAVVLTDEIEVGKTAFLRPIVIGLPNRQNILFDLETNRLAAWWMGDTARQRTRGKSWYWEAGGTSLLPLPTAKLTSELRLRRNGQFEEPIEIGQCAAEFQQLEHPAETLLHPSGEVRFTYRLKFAGLSDEPKNVFVVQTLTPPWPDAAQHAAFRRTIEIHGAAADDEFFWQPLPGGVAGGPPGSVGNWIWLPQTLGHPRVSFGLGRSWPIERDGSIQFGRARDDLKVRVQTAEYFIDLPADQFPVDPVPFPPDLSAKLTVVPGYEAIRLPLARDEMPTGLAWRPDGTLVISSLKGRVCLLHDTNGDGLEDEIKPFSDDLAAPYGVSCRGADVDVINKYGLLRLHDSDGDGHAEMTEVLADGWGYSADYHDWAVGLPRDNQGNYYVALPCQQDERSEAAARLRGWALKLVPRQPTPDNPQRFTVEKFAGGLRFPMGLALNRAGDLFATDNQGNYTPFNELNHLVGGTRYGFINKLEVKPGFAPPFQPAAVEIPHPWTRSINGICFLYTPEAVQKKLGRPLFGPLEGQLVGCEYNNRVLVRMSLERIGDTYQGAIYPFSRLPAEGEETFEGPVVCAIAPDGDLYVGNLRDSAWGGGQNTGSIVRLRPAGELPPGIAEVKAACDGFQIHFTQPIERARAADLGHYAVVSYRRIPTPAYGGADVDTKPARVRSVAVAEDGRSVRLVLDEMRPGFVYEFRLSGLAEGDKPLFPAEAYYTLRQVPR
jgi:cytochrome c551/c552